MGQVSLKKYLWWGVAFLLALFMLNTPFTVYYPLDNSAPNWLTQDASWHTILTYAVLKNWAWGKDFIYTYGPLGFLANRISMGLSIWLFLLFDLFIFINFFFLFKDLLTKSINKIPILISIAMAMLLIGTFYGTDLSWLLLIFTCYWIFKTYDTPLWRYFLILSILVALSFYIKLNTGFIGFFFLLGHLINLLFIRKISLIKSIMVSAIPLLFIGILAAALHVYLPGYVKGAIEMIKGYADIMYLDENHKKIELLLNLLFVCMLSILIFYTVILIKQKRYSLLLYVAFCMLYIVLLRKQSIFRADKQHLSEFFAYGALIFLPAYLLFHGKTLSFALPITLFLSFITFIAVTHTSTTLIKNRFLTPFNYVKGMKEFQNYASVVQKDKCYIPQPILNKIGNNTIDVFPWNSEVLLQNNLNYFPRPSFQAITAYTDYIEQLNYAHYLQHAPNFIFFDLDAVDDRYPFGEETIVHLYIAKNYLLSDTFTYNGRPWLLLQKKENTQPVHFEKTATQNIKPTDKIPISGSDYIKISLCYNFIGKLKSAYHSPSPVNIVLTTQSTSHHVFKTSTELLRTGVYTSKFISTVKDYTYLLQNKVDSLSTIDTIQLSLNPKYFRSEINIERYKIK